MNRQFQKVAAGAFLVLVSTACYDLDVTTTSDELTRDAIVNDPALVDRVIAGVGINLWAGIHNASNPHTALAVLGEEITSSANANFMWDVGHEPRTAIDNQVGAASLPRDPWSNLYEANAAATEMQRVIAENGIRILDPATGFDNTTRDITWGKFVQGTAHGYLSVLFDKAAIVNTVVDLSQVPELPFVPYTEVRDSALKWLDEAAALAEANVFTFPYADALWFWNTPLSNGEFAQIIHSIAARVMVYSARDPVERAAVDWERVLFHLDRAITVDFGPGGDGSRPNTLLTWGYKIRAFNPPDQETVGSNQTSSSGSARVDLRLLGPADTVMIDTNGDNVPDKFKYQAWLEKVDNDALRDTVVGWEVVSPDRRIGRATQPPGDPTPVFFRYTDVAANTNQMPPERGAYYQSPYWSASRTRAQTGRNTTANFDDIRDIGMTVAEMDMLRAEALIRLGRPDEAATAINRTRTANGGLPAVTAGGPPQATAAEQASCVPRLYDGSCGNLFHAMMYEKRIEAYGTHGIMVWADLRGWGCLLEGTPTELPIPGRQLDLLGEAVYTFGGEPGERGSAPIPTTANTNCHLLLNPIVRGNG